MPIADTATKHRLLLQWLILVGVMGFVLFVVWHQGLIALLLDYDRSRISLAILIFMVAILFMNPIAKLGTANLKAEFIITLTWPDNQPDDLDIWVEDPHGEIVSYLQREAGWLHLDRDDRGSLNDTIEINGQKILHPINQEVVTMRGIISGEYVVNVYYYESVTRGPVSATVQIDKINPVLETVFFDRVVLEKQDVEKTVVRFRVSDRGEVVGIDRRPRRPTPYALEG